MHLAMHECISVLTLSSKVLARTVKNYNPCESHQFFLISSFLVKEHEVSASLLVEDTSSKSQKCNPRIREVFCRWFV